ncbi:MAG: hypothetical protein ACLSCE_11365 [Bacteroides cellulosilyticus]
MKHKILLVLLLGLMVSFTASAQKVTLQFRQVKLAKVFDAITQQTGLTVAYSRPTVDPDRMVTIEANKMKICPMCLVNCSLVRMWPLKLVRRKSI